MGDIVLYAKKSCTQCKKAIAFLTKKGVPYLVKDIVHEPPPRSLLEKVIKAENIYASLNQRSTTYKDNQLGKRRTTKNEAIRLMLKDPNLIKRPLIIKDNKAYQGFDEKSLLDFVTLQAAALAAAAVVPVVPVLTETV
ncbi:MAG: Spx/MgsR family RNA polymerase-binding regulatory protein [Proteobacteria bacterium]|nr:Spx/MgsR family RNA polymerase-binding regulatory protein [Pseudomonadota bacterium]